MSGECFAKYSPIFADCLPIMSAENVITVLLLIYFLHAALIIHTSWSTYYQTGLRASTEMGGGNRSKHSKMFWLSLGLIVLVKG